MAAPSWTYGGWRRESGSTAQRTMLILHAEEVEAYIAGYQSQTAHSNAGERFGLDAYLKKLETKLAEYDAALGLTLESNQPSFVGMRPRID